MLPSSITCCHPGFSPLHLAGGGLVPPPSSLADTTNREGRRNAAGAVHRDVARTEEQTDGPTFDQYRAGESTEQDEWRPDQLCSAHCPCACMYGINETANGLQQQQQQQQQPPGLGLASWPVSSGRRPRSGNGRRATKEGGGLPCNRLSRLRYRGHEPRELKKPPHSTALRGPHDWRGGVGVLLVQRG